MDGIIIGGDFNSVEEQVRTLLRPLEPLEAAKYTQVRVEGDTEVSPTTFFQEGYALSRKIDHIFVKCMSEADHYVEASAGKVGDGRKGALNPLAQTLFDHEAVSAEIEIKMRWLTMLRRRFSYQKPEPREPRPSVVDNVNPDEI